MRYFPDYSPYAYGHASHRGVVHVGWLDNIHPYPKGMVDVRLIGKMKSLARTPWNFIGASTSVNCALNRPGLLKQSCPTGASTRTVLAGNGPANAQVMVKLECLAKGLYSLPPVLIVHYIEAHGYLPPAEFLRAVDHTLS